MREREAFDYAILRVVPRVDRQEFVNVGIILFSRRYDLLICLIDDDLSRVQALSPELDIALVRRQLDSIEAICDGKPETGKFALLDKSERFNWLAAPTSTIIQTSPVHCGLTDDPDQALDDLFELLVK